MDEASDTLQQAPATNQVQRQAMGRAVRVLARRKRSLPSRPAKVTSDVELKFTTGAGSDNLVARIRHTVVSKLIRGRRQCLT